MSVANFVFTCYPEVRKSDGCLLFFKMVPLGHTTGPDTSPGGQKSRDQGSGIMFTIVWNLHHTARCATQFLSFNLILPCQLILTPCSRVDCIFTALIHWHDWWSLMYCAVTLSMIYFDSVKHLYQRQVLYAIVQKCRHWDRYLIITTGPRAFDKCGSCCAPWLGPMRLSRYLTYRNR